MQWLRSRKPLIALLVGTLLLCLLPYLDIALEVGKAWQGILPVFTDELNYARVHTIGVGHLTMGNAYYLEHTDGPPLVVFGGAWLNALPLLLGVPFVWAMTINFIVWALLFAISAYWLLRELLLGRWTATFGALFLYVQSYAHIWRTVNLQPVFPFYFLFYGAFLRLMREQNRKNIILLAIAIGTSFYLLAYLWQVAVTTMGLLILYALATRQWKLCKASIVSLIAGGVLGSPVPLYMLWLSHSSPYFWESIGRLGLVSTHLPMAEIIYSGGFVIFLVLSTVALHRWNQILYKDERFGHLVSYIALTGLGLWIMQGSNVLTGKLLETGEHIRVLMVPWLAFTTLSVGAYLWRIREQLSVRVRTVAALVLGIAAMSAVLLGYEYIAPFIQIQDEGVLWRDEQLYAGPFDWLNAHVPKGSVVWSDPHDYLASNLPIFTSDFSLYSYWGMLELAPDNEIEERYLVSQYFNDPTVEKLKSLPEMTLYLGRQDVYHLPETKNRKVKICQLLFFFNKQRCGSFVTPQSLKGDAFFNTLEARFTNDIKPNIKAYLTKYHVSYILKDDRLDPTYNPKLLGASLVYKDARYEIYKLPGL